MTSSFSRTLASQIGTGLRAGLLATTLLAASHGAHAQGGQVGTLVGGNNGMLPLPTGQFITPTMPLTAATQQFLNPGLPAYPNFVAGEAVRVQLSPDGTTLAVLCAGQNSLDNAAGVADLANSTQYVFIYDVSGANKQVPALRQVIKQPNAHVGLVWAPDGNTLYATGGNDDAVYAYAKSGGSYTLAATIQLGHSATHGNAGIGLAVQPNASGLAISSDGATLVVANNYNDSISVIDTASRAVRYEQDLRPYANEGTQGVPGGEYPWAVAIKGTAASGRQIAYVSSNRDREVVVMDITSPTAARLVGRIKLDGNGLGMALNPAQTTLYVAQDNADEVAVIDTASNTVTRKIDTRAPAGVINSPLTGVSPITVTLSPDGNTLYAVNDGANSIAVVPLTGPGAFATAGLIPTAYAPKDVAFSADGTFMYIINGKSDQGPNPGHLAGATGNITSVTYPGGNAAASTAARASNQYQFQLEHASLVSTQTPAASDLASLTAQVAQNNGYSASPNSNDAAVMGFLHGKIQHVIYVVKENRTFDQILGDLGNGSNGDETLAQFGKRLTPNFHRIATNFVTLDNFMDPADGSMDGWSWSMRGRITSLEGITQQLNYAFVNRGLSYESEGSNRNTPIGLASTAARDAATGGRFSSLSANEKGGTDNLLPGQADVAATDAPWGQQKSFIFDAVMQSGLTVRNYGWMVNNIGPTTDANGNPITNAGAQGVVQAAALNPTLLPVTDVYFRGFDMNYADVWDFNEWNREFQGYVQSGTLPNLETVRLSHDHTGSYGTALAGVNTPDTQEADNDLAVGRLVQAVAQSPFASSTLIIVTEDDTQDGPDHVDSHRSTTYMVGPYVKRDAVVSTRYNQVSVLRTIEDILGTPHINLNTAYQPPMTDVFDVNGSPNWTFTAVASPVLRTTQIAAADLGVKYAEGPDIQPRQDAAYWARATRGFDFSNEDRAPADLFNEVLWAGTMDGEPYPRILGASPPASPPVDIR